MTAGLAFGICVGVATAITGFQTVAQFMGEPAQYRLGYIAGMADTVTAVGDFSIDSNTAISYVRTAAGCLVNRQMNLDRLESYLVSQMPTGAPANQAASVFVTTLSGCP
jgi:hypothetical protein